MVFILLLKDTFVKVFHLLILPYFIYLYLKATNEQSGLPLDKKILTKTLRNNYFSFWFRLVPINL